MSNKDQKSSHKEKIENQADAGQEDHSDELLPLPVDPQAIEAKEIHDQQTALRRRRLLPRALATGVLAGLLGVAFRLSLEAGGDKRSDWLVGLKEGSAGWGWIFTMLFCAGCGALAVWLVKRFAPEAAGSGIPHVKEVINNIRSLRWIRTTLVKFFGGILAIGSGMALGREGPTVQMGAAMGELVGEKGKSQTFEKRNLISAGAGAGLTAAFNAPLAGILFVIEELHGRITPNTLFGAFIACVSADIVMRLILGQSAYFGIVGFAATPLHLLPVFLVLGIITGLGGVFFNVGLIKSLDFFAARRGKLPLWWGGAFVGAIVGLLAWVMPEALGDGHKLAHQMLYPGFVLAMIPAYFIIRFLMTLACYGCGAPGGIFAPILVLGGLVGLALGAGCLEYIPDFGEINLPILAVVGMGAFLVGSVRAPLTGMVLIIEMTGEYKLILPLMVACLSAYGIAQLTGNKPIYDALMERDISRASRNH